MATITARNVNDAHYAILCEGAAEHGHSVSEELRQLIADYARARRTNKRVTELGELRRRYPIRLAPDENSVSLIRAIRDDE